MKRDRGTAGIISGQRLKCAVIAGLMGLLHTPATQATDLYWDAVPGTGVGGPVSGTANWLGTTKWSTTSTGANADDTTWVNGANAIFAGTATVPTVIGVGDRGVAVNSTAANPISLSSLTFLVSSTLSPVTNSPGFSFTGPAPSITLSNASGATGYIYSKISSANLVKVQKGGTSGAIVLNLFGSNSFDGGIELVDPMRFNINANGAAGIAGHAGDILVDSTDTIITSVGSLSITTNQTYAVYNNIKMNNLGLTGAAFRTSFGATAASPAVLTLDYRGQISGDGDVIISNSTFAGGGGAGRTQFSNHLNNYTGATIINNTASTGAFILGADDVIPDASNFIIGNAQNRVNAPVDMNGHNETVASISTNLGLGGTAKGITNTSATTSTLTIAGMTGQTYTYNSIIGATSNDTVFTGSVQGNNKLALVLAATNDPGGTLVLGGASTYTEGTTINGGILKLASTGSLASTGKLTLSGSGKFDLATKTQQIGELSGTGGTILSTGGAGNLNVQFNSTTKSYAGVITGSVNLAKSGTGVLSLDGANDYTGTTTVNGGTLLINDTLGSSPSVITVNQNATLGGIGKTGAGGAVTVNSGGALAPGKTTAGALAGTFTADSLTLNPNATLKFDLNAPIATNDKVVVTNALSITNGSSPINIDINNLGGIAAGTYHLLNYGSLTGSLSDLVLHSFPTNFGFNLVPGVNSVDLVVSTLAPTKTWLGTTADWNTGSNWSPSAFATNDPVLFNDSAGNKNVVISSPVAPGPITFNNNSDYTISGAAITGTLPLTKSGTGKLTLSGVNSFSGPIVINGGTLSVAANNNLGAPSNSITLANATLEATGTFTANRGVTLNGPAIFSVTPGNTLTVGGVIGGPADLTISGTGSVNLTNPANAYQGSTTVAANTSLLVGASEVIPDSSAVNLAAGSTLNLATFTETVGSISGSGQIVFGAGAALTAGGDDTTTTFSGQITGAGSLTKTGAGTLTLTNTANSFGGSGKSVTVNGGTLAITADTQLGNSANSVNIADTATLAIDTSSAAYSSARAVNLVSASAGTFSTIKVTGASGATLTGKVGGSNAIAGLTKSGNGDLTLTNTSNNFAGLTISGGTVISATDTALGGGDITLNGGTLKLTGAINTNKSIIAGLSTGGTIDTGPNNVTINGTISGPQNSPITKIGSGKLLLTQPSLANANVFNGAWNVLDGTLAINTVSQGTGGPGTPQYGVSPLGIGGSTTATLFNNAVTVKQNGIFQIEGVDLGQSDISTSLTPRIYLDNGGTLQATGNTTTSSATASFGRSDGALYVVRGTDAANPSIVKLKTAANGAITSPVFTINDPILQQENPLLQPYPVSAGTTGNVIIQVSGPGRIVLADGNRATPRSLGNVVVNATNFAGSWDIQSGILQIGPSTPNDQAFGFSPAPLGEPLNALGYGNNDPAQANPVLLSGGTLAVAVDAHNANPNITDPYANPADPTIDYIRSPITLKGGAIASTGSEVSYGVNTTDPQAVPTGVPVTAHFGGAFTVAANATNSRVLTYDPVDHSSPTDPFHTANQVRTVDLVGSANTTWVGTLEIDPGVTTGGAFNINRTGGTVAVTPGAKILVDSGASLRLNGAGALSDGANSVDITNNSTATGVRVESGAHTVGNLDGTGATTLSPAVTLTATRIRQNTLTIGAGAAAVITPGGTRANTVSKLNSLDLGGTPANPAGTLNLNNHDLILANGVIADVTSQILHARAGGQWTGTGITSTTAKNTGYALGSLLNGTPGSPRIPTFDGQSTVGGEVLVKYTVYGDIDLNGTVDINDLGILSGHWLENSNLWGFGDLDGSGKVDINDLGILSGHWLENANPGGAPVPGPSFAQALEEVGFSSVPEPTTLATLALAATPLLARRHRKASSSR